MGRLVEWFRGLFGAPPADCTVPPPQGGSSGAPPKISPEDDSILSSLWDGFTDDDGVINTHHPVFQVGRYLYDAQVLYADAEAFATGNDKPGVTQAITPERVMQQCRRYCQLVNALGQLRADYNQKVELLRNLTGKRISDLMR